MLGKEKIYQDLQEKIIHFKYIAGQRLNEKELMQEYKIGRTPLREILMKLQYDSLVETVPQSGTFVKEVDLKETQDVLETRIPLEMLAIKMIVSNISKAKITLMKILIEELKETYKDKSTQESKTSTDKIHNLYYESCENKVLSQTLIRLHNLSSRAWFSEGYDRKPMKNTIVEWEKILGYIEDKNILALEVLIHSRIYDFAKALNIDTSYIKTYNVEK